MGNTQLTSTGTTWDPMMGNNSTGVAQGRSHISLDVGEKMREK